MISIEQIINSYWFIFVILKNEAKKVSVDNTKQCKNVTPNNIYNNQTTPKPLTSEVPAISNLSQVSSSHAEAVNKAANKILVGSSVSLATTTTRYIFLSITIYD